MLDRLPLLGAETTVPGEVPVFHRSKGPGPIESESGSLFDADRAMTVQYELFRPQELNGPHPVVVYSLPTVWGRDRPKPKGNYIVEHLAAHGYVTVIVWHLESDKDVLPDDVDDVENPREVIKKSAHQREKAHNRFVDISFVLDTLERWNDEGPLAGHIDLTRIGVSGYSFGAMTALVLLGEKVGPQRRSYKDERIKAGVCYGAIAEPPDTPRDEFAAVDRPILYFTGARDRTWAFPTLPEDNRRAYDMSPASNQYLLVLRAADHITVGGLRRDEGRAGLRETYNHRLVQSVGLAFWDAFLKDDADARQWLDEELASQLGRNGRFERK